MDPLGVPSCEAMVTVGRVAIVAAAVGLSLENCVMAFAQIWLWAKGSDASCKGLAQDLGETLPSLSEPTFSPPRLVLPSSFTILHKYLKLDRRPVYFCKAMGIKKRLAIESGSTGL